MAQTTSACPAAALNLLLLTDAQMVLQTQQISRLPPPNFRSTNAQFLERHAPDFSAVLRSARRRCEERMVPRIERPSIPDDYDWLTCSCTLVETDVAVLRETLATLLARKVQTTISRNVTVSPHTWAHPYGSTEPLRELTNTSVPRSFETLVQTATGSFDMSTTSSGQPGTSGPGDSDAARLMGVLSNTFIAGSYLGTPLQLNRSCMAVRSGREGRDTGSSHSGFFNETPMRTVSTLISVTMDGITHLGEYLQNERQWKCDSALILSLQCQQEVEKRRQGRLQLRYRTAPEAAIISTFWNTVRVGVTAAIRSSDPDVSTSENASEAERTGVAVSVEEPIGEKQLVQEPYGESEGTAEEWTGQLTTSATPTANQSPIIEWKPASFVPPHPETARKTYPLVLRLLQREMKALGGVISATLTLPQLLIANAIFDLLTPNELLFTVTSRFWLHTASFVLSGGRLVSVSFSPQEDSAFFTRQWGAGCKDRVLLNSSAQAGIPAAFELPLRHVAFSRIADHVSSSSLAPRDALLFRLLCLSRAIINIGSVNRVDQYTPISIDGREVSAALGCIVRETTNRSRALFGDVLRRSSARTVNIDLLNRTCAILGSCETCPARSSLQAFRAAFVDNNFYLFDLYGGRDFPLTMSEGALRMRLAAFHDWRHLQHGNEQGKHSHEAPDIGVEPSTESITTYLALRRLYGAYVVKTQRPGTDWRSISQSSSHVPTHSHGHGTPVYEYPTPQQASPYLPDRRNLEYLLPYQMGGLLNLSAVYMAGSSGFTLRAPRRAGILRYVVASFLANHTALRENRALISPGPALKPNDDVSVLISRETHALFCDEAKVEPFLRQYILRCFGPDALQTFCAENFGLPDSLLQQLQAIANPSNPTRLSLTQFRNAAEDRREDQELSRPALGSPVPGRHPTEHPARALEISVYCCSSLRGAHVVATPDSGHRRTRTRGSSYTPVSQEGQQLAMGTTSGRSQPGLGINNLPQCTSIPERYSISSGEKHNLNRLREATLRHRSYVLGSEAQGPTSVMPNQRLAINLFGAVAESKQPQTVVSARLLIVTYDALSLYPEIMSDTVLRFLGNAGKFDTMTVHRQRDHAPELRFHIYPARFRFNTETSYFSDAGEEQAAEAQCRAHAQQRVERMEAVRETRSLETPATLTEDISECSTPTQLARESSVSESRDESVIDRESACLQPRYRRVELSHFTLGDVERLNLEDWITLVTTTRESDVVTLLANPLIHLAFLRADKAFSSSVYLAELHAPPPSFTFTLPTLSRLPPVAPFSSWLRKKAALRIHWQHQRLSAAREFIDALGVVFKSLRAPLHQLMQHCQYLSTGVSDLLLHDFRGLATLGLYHLPAAGPFVPQHLLARTLASLVERTSNPFFSLVVDTTWHTPYRWGQESSPLADFYAALHECIEGVVQAEIARLIQRKASRRQEIELRPSHGPVIPRASSCTVYGHLSAASEACNYLFNRTDQYDAVSSKKNAHHAITMQAQLLGQLLDSLIEATRLPMPYARHACMSHSVQSDNGILSRAVIDECSETLRTYDLLRKAADLCHFQSLIIGAHTETLLTDQSTTLHFGRRISAARWYNVLGVFVLENLMVLGRNQAPQAVLQVHDIQHVSKPQALGLAGLTDRGRDCYLVRLSDDTFLLQKLTFKRKLSARYRGMETKKRLLRHILELERTERDLHRQAFLGAIVYQDTVRSLLDENPFRQLFVVMDCFDSMTTISTSEKFAIHVGEAELISTGPHFEDQFDLIMSRHRPGRSPVGQAISLFARPDEFPRRYQVFLPVRSLMLQLAPTDEALERAWGVPHDFFSIRAEYETSNGATLSSRLRAVLLEIEETIVRGYLETLPLTAEILCSEALHPSISVLAYLWSEERLEFSSNAVYNTTPALITIAFSIRRMLILTSRAGSITHNLSDMLAQFALGLEGKGSQTQKYTPSPSFPTASFQVLGSEVVVPEYPADGYSIATESEIPQVVVPSQSDGPWSVRPDSEPPLKRTPILELGEISEEEEPQGFDDTPQVPDFDIIVIVGSTEDVLDTVEALLRYALSDCRIHLVRASSDDFRQRFPAQSSDRRGVRFDGGRGLKSQSPTASYRWVVLQSSYSFQLSAGLYQSITRGHVFILPCVSVYLVQTALIWAGLDMSFRCWYLLDTPDPASFPSHPVPPGIQHFLESLGDESGMNRLLTATITLLGSLGLHISRITNLEQARTSTAQRYAPHRPQGIVGMSGHPLRMAHSIHQRCLKHAIRESILTPALAMDGLSELRRTLASTLHDPRDAALNSIVSAFTGGASDLLGTMELAGRIPGTPVANYGRRPFLGCRPLFFIKIYSQIAYLRVYANNTRLEEFLLTHEPVADYILAAHTEPHQSEGGFGSGSGGGHLDHSSAFPVTVDLMRLQPFTPRSSSRAQRKHQRASVTHAMRVDSLDPQTRQLRTVADGMYATRHSELLNHMGAVLCSLVHERFGTYVNDFFTEKCPATGSEVNIAISPILPREQHLRHLIPPCEWILRYRYFIAYDDSIQKPDQQYTRCTLQQLVSNSLNMHHSYSCVHRFITINEQLVDPSSRPLVDMLRLEISASFTTTLAIVKKLIATFSTQLGHTNQMLCNQMIARNDVAIDPFAWRQVYDRAYHIDKFLAQDSIPNLEGTLRDAVRRLPYMPANSQHDFVGRGRRASNLWYTLRGGLTNAEQVVNALRELPAFNSVTMHEELHGMWREMETAGVAEYEKAAFILLAFDYQRNTEGLGEAALQTSPLQRQAAHVNLCLANNALWLDPPKGTPGNAHPPAVDVRLEPHAVFDVTPDATKAYDAWPSCWDYEL
ncbi:hypothetical protein GMRT_15886 [Giardia muris]|uniref:Uncharacterized protein n=1 Tax=Giardia muris TaxID=5742 RepID=A0A4Z1SVZ1_GIAMU|nr:hypothetical protein GMRT_15886 [Giardia muris]|eukprot:TNJ29934.1 hypothetical protein GMRT_15886 [Giardia muris]